MYTQPAPRSVHRIADLRSGLLHAPHVSACAKTTEEQHSQSSQAVSARSAAPVKKLTIQQPSDSLGVSEVQFARAQPVHVTESASQRKFTCSFASASMNSQKHVDGLRPPYWPQSHPVLPLLCNEPILVPPSRNHSSTNLSLKRPREYSASLPLGYETRRGGCRCHSRSIDSTQQSAVNMRGYSGRTQQSGSFHSYRCNPSHSHYMTHSSHDASIPFADRHTGAAFESSCLGSASESNGCTMDEDCEAAGSRSESFNPRCTSSSGSSHLDSAGIGDVVAVLRALHACMSSLKGDVEKMVRVLSSQNQSSDAHSAVARDTRVAVQTQQVRQPSPIAGTVGAPKGSVRRLTQTNGNSAPSTQLESQHVSAARSGVHRVLGCNPAEEFGAKSAAMVKESDEFDDEIFLL